MIVLCADELREREIQQDQWAQDAPTSSLGQMLRMQEITLFNHQMTRKYGHLRKTRQEA